MKTNNSVTLLSKQDIVSDFKYTDIYNGKDQRTI